MIEIELKCEISPSLLERVREKVQNMEYKGTIHNYDVYYDTPTWTLLRRGVFVRVRNSQMVAFKFNEDLRQEHGLVNERTFPLASSPAQVDAMNALLTYFLPSWHPAPSFEDAVRQNGLLELATIENTREEYIGEHILLSIDHVKALGNFLEIETLVEDGADTREGQERLQAFVSDLEVEHIKVGYVELWLHKYNPEAYAVGRYHL